MIDLDPKTHVFYKEKYIEFSLFYHNFIENCEFEDLVSQNKNNQKKIILKKMKKINKLYKDRFSPEEFLVWNLEILDLLMTSKFKDHPNYAAAAALMPIISPSSSYDVLPTS